MNNFKQSVMSLTSRLSVAKTWLAPYLQEFLVGCDKLHLFVVM